VSYTRKILMTPERCGGDLEVRKENLLSIYPLGKDPGWRVAA
jgi:hypothetical protein